MANRRRTENTVSVWGYFGYGRPLTGVLLSIIICVLFAVAGIPYMAVLFGVLSLGFLYGVFRSCQVVGREGLNSSATVRSNGNWFHRNQSGVDNPVFLELTATALARNPRYIPGYNTPGSFPSNPNGLRIDDQPPNYFEIFTTPNSTELPSDGGRGVVEGDPTSPTADVPIHSGVSPTGDNGITDSIDPLPSAGADTSFNTPSHLTMAQETEYHVPSASFTPSRNTDLISSNAALVPKRLSISSIDNLPSYDEAVQHQDLHYDDTAL